ncbi:MAG: alpha/beta hydrolase [Lysinibacillus sp.]
MGANNKIIKGAEAFFIKGNEIGLLISHGFMGTPQSVRFIGEQLANLGYTVLAPRLSGHGTDYYDLEKCYHEDWFSSLAEGYQTLKKRCTTVFVIGQSMGGTLSLWLAKKHPDISGLMLINAALSIPSLEHLQGQSAPRFIAEGHPDIKDRSVYEITYDQAPLHAIHELQKLMASTPAVLKSIHCPILGIKSAIDHVVPPQNTDFILANTDSKNKQLIVLENSYHVASMDFDKITIVESCHQFVQNLLQQKKQAI